MFNRILLAIDDSPSGPAAASFAIAMARKEQAPVRVIHVNEFAVGGRGHTLETRAEAAKVLDDAVSDLRAAGVVASGLVVTSTCFNVARRVAEVAEEWGADVIVVGSRRRRRLAGLAGKGFRERITGLISLPVMTAPAPLRVGRRGPNSTGSRIDTWAPEPTPVRS
jgi:nucleotide-binding universal stress UspA family protein